MAKCELYQDVKCEWRWRRLSKEGKIEAFSKQGFEDEDTCKENGKETGECSGYTRKS